MTTLMGIAPPSVAPAAPKRAEQQSTPAAEPAAVTSPAEPAAATPASPPPAGTPPPAPAPEPVAAASTPGPAEGLPSVTSTPPAVVTDAAPAVGAQAASAPKTVAALAPVTAPDSLTANSSERSDSEIVEFRSRGKGRGLLLAAAATLLAGGLWFGLRSKAPESASTPEAAEAPAAEPPAAEPVAAPPPSPASPEPPAAEAPAEQAAANPAGAEASAAPSTEAPAAGNDDVRVVIVKVHPAEARFYHKGKKVGSSPLRVELAPGEKRAFEVGHPDFNTRKVVIDGSKPEVIVGLFPKSAAPPSSETTAE